MTNKHLRKCSNFESPGKFKLKHDDTTTYLLEWQKLKTDNTKSCWEYGTNGTFVYCWWGFKFVKPLWKRA